MQTFSHLADTFAPTHYDLSLTLHRIDRVFSGTVTVTGTLGSSDYLPLHAKDLKIDKVLIDGKPATSQQSDHDELRLSQDGLQAGEHIVVVQFSGTITDAMHGLYPCYFEVDGKKQELLATQFESHHAREVFPCVDEPRAKATFDVSLTTEEAVTVLGNMPVLWQRSEPEGLVTKFATTPKMSSYLLAWVVGELHKKTAQTKDGVEVNVWATKAQPADSLDFALKTAVDCIEFYNDYFATAYPLPKSDHVALPDFTSGAMENWGLITYREIALLAGTQTTISSKRYIATVICHELSHQWFGNLVTMQWWDDLWLNESFATIMEYVAVDALYPEWNIFKDFSASEGIMALRRDALDGVQSVHMPVTHPDEISTLFDASIVYAKGARLMRMLEHYIGEEAFRSGLRQYFAQHAYANTVGQDLWDALSVSSKKDIAGFMNAWITQSGYPVVTVAQDGDSLTLSQAQFFVGPHESSQRIWPIPIDASDETLPRLLQTPESTVTLASEHSAIRLNKSDSGHFITRYDDALLAALITELEKGHLDDIARLQLLHEQSLLAKGGLLSTAALVPLLWSYREETSEQVWGIIGLAIGELRRVVEDDEASEQLLKTYVRRIVEKQYQRLGWQQQPDEAEDDTTLRTTILGLVLYSEDKTAIDEAHRRYGERALEALDTELRSLLISNEVRWFDTDGSVAKNLLDTYAKTDNNDIQQDICVGITSVRSESSIKLLLTSLTDSEIVRKQDVARWFAYLVRGRWSKTLAWKWIRDEWGWIDTHFSGDKSMDYFPRYAASALSTNAEQKEYIAFFEPLKSDASLARAITIGQGEIAGRIAWIAKDKPAVSQALREQTR